MKLHPTFYAVLCTLPLVAVSACDNKASPAIQSMPMDEHRTYPQADDSTMIRNVSNALLSDEALARSRINVAAHRGHITLSGTVASMQDKNRAVEIAKTVTGVIEVHDTLEINQATVGY
ncbi:MAG: BON domain-containing protein [Alkalimonas sp.]|nr:BON domain-containing protein [Alkalimonas sp.]